MGREREREKKGVGGERKRREECRGGRERERKNVGMGSER